MILIMKTYLNFGNKNNPLTISNKEASKRITQSPIKESVSKFNIKIKEKAAPDEQQSRDNSKIAIENALNELNLLVGLEQVKQFISELLAFMEIQRKRAKENLAAEPQVLHMIFKGNPGTGKTTVARILGKFFKEMNFLSKGHLVEIERADIVGEYIGHTAQKTRDQIKKALGGILFIDEAYSLARGGEKDFGKEAIDTMVKAMEDYKDQFIIVLAGYTEEMEFFIRSNPGLRSRFPIHIHFPDYALLDLIEIGKRMLTKRQYLLTPEAERQLEIVLGKHFRTDQLHSGNARLVRNIIEKAIRRQAVRLVALDIVTKEDLMTISPEDISDEPSLGREEKPRYPEIKLNNGRIAWPFIKE